MVGPVLRDAFSLSTAPPALAPDWVFLQLVPLGRWRLVRGSPPRRASGSAAAPRDLLREPGARSPISVMGKVSLPCGLIVSVRGRNCWQDQVSNSLFPLLRHTRPSLGRGGFWGWVRI